MQLYATDPLFAWARLEDHPDLSTLRQLLEVLPDQALLDGLHKARGKGRDDFPVSVLWGVVVFTIALPPLRVTGRIHVPMGGRPIDGLLNVTDRFVAMTDATLESGLHPDLARSAAAVAIRRDRAHVLLVADDENSEQLLADVLDERTAESWLHRAEEDA